MTARSPEQWWTATWSPVTGCTPAGAGCAHCHALARMRRHLPALRGEGNANVPATTVLCHGERLSREASLALAKKRAPQTILCCMMGDLFHEQVPFDFVSDVLEAFVWANDLRLHPDLRESDWRNRETPLPLHQLCVLTKRWGRALGALHLWQEEQGPHGQALLDSILLMASVATQSEADAACSALSRLRGVRWGLHVEPMLGPIDLSYQHPGATGAAMGDVSWIVVGAEQGPGARPFELDWARSLRDQCRAASVPFWFKRDSRRREPPTDLCVRETPWR
jgi:protein gp37